MKIYMNKCPKCNLENYALMVPSGICAFCGYKATEEDVNKKTIWMANDKNEKLERRSNEKRPS